MHLVHIVSSEAEARLVFDPIRWEILRLLAKETLSECNLATLLGLSAPTIGHHLKALEGVGLVKIVKFEPEAHGIVQKFYESTAQIYFADMTSAPASVKRRLLPARVERVRGMLAGLSLNGGFSASPSYSNIERITEELEPLMLKAAEKYSGPYNGEDSELVVSEIYRDALRTLLRSRPELFQRVLYAVQK